MAYKMTRERVGIVVRMSIAAILASCITVGCIGYIAKSERERRMALEQIQQVSHEVVVETEPEPVDEIPQPTEPVDEHLMRRIDFAELQSINTDATRWMFVPGTAIDSYVLQEQTVGLYRYDLSDIYHKYNGSGSFLVPAASRDGDGNLPDDAHTLILGHRMNSRHGEWQFSELPTRWATVDGAKAYPYVYLYHPDRAERWRVWAGMDAWASDMIYDIPYDIGSEDYENMLTHAAQSARYLIGEQPDADTRTLFLSTCNRPDGGALRRFVLILVPDAIYQYDTGEYMDMNDAKAEAKWREKHAANENRNIQAYEDAIHDMEVTPLTSVDGQSIQSKGGEE